MDFSCRDGNISAKFWGGGDGEEGGDETCAVGFAVRDDLAAVV
jgi:hypothetical protein